MAGVIAVEGHMDGSAHVHGLLGLRALQDGDVRLLSERWFTPHGYVKLDRPRSSEDVAAYCGKYLCKDMGELVFSRDLVRQAALFRRNADCT